VLLEPEIPANTGNIGRTCVVTNTSLHLIRPLGFNLSEKEIKRAGLDYWPDLDLHVHESFQDFLSECGQCAKLHLATTKALSVYSEVSYGMDDYIMFGKESAGIPEEILVSRKDDCIRIPMLTESRSLNLANSVAIVLYEALRQNGFPGLKRDGQLHRGRWDAQ
jgi:tRNA (cytidine/uridine-2'-O-)-methyltransferase